MAVQPREKGLMVYTLRRANEVRKMSAINEFDDVPETINEAEVKLAQ